MPDPTLKDLRLVADIGGTNARLALSFDGAILPDTVQTYANDQWDSLHAVIRAFLEDKEHPVSEMVIAVAGPVNGSAARLTNHDWQIEVSELQMLFHCSHVKLLNDLNALGYAAPFLTTDQLRQVSAGQVTKAGQSQSLVVGVGTGFNVSPVLEKAGMLFCPAVEAGHITLPLSISRGLEALGVPTDEFGTIELLFSGRGLTKFCRAMTGDALITGPEAISAFGKDGAEETTRAITVYAGLLGRLLGDLSMAYMPTSGIYLAGSVARALMQVASSECLEALRRPAHVCATIKPSVWIIENDTAALVGCARYGFD